jgi:dolichol-phosphate mannosyltransferase
MSSAASSERELGSERALVVIPTYNEGLNLEELVRRVRTVGPEIHLLIVDDSSPDGTGLIADRLAEADPFVHVLHRSQKLGLGRAYVDGFHWALRRDFTIICEMDADGSHEPERLPDLIAGLEDSDLVIGSRWIDGGAVVDWPWYRILLSRMGNLYTKLLLRLSVRDSTAGFRAFRRSALEEVDLENIASEGYCFQVDVTRRVIANGARVKEIPIRFIERQRGSSKMSGRIVREALIMVTLWGLADRWNNLAKALRVRPRQFVHPPTESVN